MPDPEKLPRWLKSLPLAPEYRPTETEFADPIAFISRIEREAAAFGICKIIPPLPKPSKKFVLSNLTRSIPTRFTTRQQELGARKSNRHRQQVWQSGEFYTLEQFESKSKAFQKSQLSGFNEVTPLLVESLFWKAASEKPIYIEYANDVPGSGFAAHEEPFLYRKRRRKLADPGRSSGDEGSAGWKLSNSPWNLQVIARAPGSLTRFMPDEVPGVTSPMVYIGMLFSWFAWHVEDHELHSLNFLHMGASKTWYAVPGEYASTLEEVVRVDGYGGDLDRLESFTMLGEKTTLLSPEVIVSRSIPCCRLVQHPGEFVVTFPRAYHIGFSHGFNCGEAANFATSQWLKVAKEAAIRRAAMNHLPMLSHQQLLYMLTVSFISRVPRALLSGVRSSRLSDRKREEKEILVKKAFLNDMMNENDLLLTLLQKGAASYAVLWEPDLLPNSCTASQSFSSSIPLEVQGSSVNDEERRDMLPCNHKTSHSSKDSSYNELIASQTSISFQTHVEKDKNNYHADGISSVELLEILDAEEDDLPFGLNIDSGTLACVACGILGYPFMAIVQPSDVANTELYHVNGEKLQQKLGRSECSYMPSCLPHTACKFQPEGTCNTLREQENPDSSGKVPPAGFDYVSSLKGVDASDDIKLLNDSGWGGSMKMANLSMEIDLSKAIVPGTKPIFKSRTVRGAPVNRSSDENMKWTPSNGFNRPRIFCLQHALEVEELLHSKGGAQVLIICHSDYLKIKAYAPSIAEEVGMRFNLTDVPLESASPSDLNLINESLDNGEHEESDEHWTSKLGVNLRYCMKLRKQSTSKKERLTLVLGRLFSDPFSLSDFSTLKWHSRRSRTPYKVVGLSISKSYDNPSMEKHIVVKENLHAKFATKDKYYHSYMRKLNDMVSQDHSGREDIMEQFDSSNASLGKDDCSSSHSHNLSEKVEEDNTGLLTVPISADEHLHLHQNSWFPLEVSIASDVIDSEIYKTCHPCVVIPVFESSGICEGMNSLVELVTKCRVDKSNNSESPPELLLLQDVNSEAQQKTEALGEINSEDNVDNNVGSTVNSTSVGAAADSGELPDTPVMQGPNSWSGLVNLLSPADQSHVTVVPYNSAEMNFEVSYSDEPNMEVKVAHALNSEEQLVSNLSTVDGLHMQEKEIPKVKAATEVEATMEGRANNSSQLVEQTVGDLCTSARCRMQQQEIPQLDMQISEVPKLEVNVDPSLRADHQFVNDMSTADSCGIQQELYSAKELADEGGDSHSSRSEGFLVCNVSTVDTRGRQQEENSAAVDNLRSGVSHMQPKILRFTNAPMVDCSEMQQETTYASEARISNEVKCLDPVVDGSSVNSAAERSEVQESAVNKEHLIVGCNKNSDTACMIHYVRRRTKRKPEEQAAESHSKRREGIICADREDHITEGTRYNGIFIRSPCEGLRPRTVRAMTAPDNMSHKQAKQNKTVSKLKRKAGKNGANEPYECEIDGCRAKFWRKKDLHLHMKHRCTHEGCRKQLRSHKELMWHNRVHDAERPLKCPWKTCRMSFKWEWARTEHIRIHTGERPYQCPVPGCEMTFRYVSAFSRHRRKTGHSLKQADH